MKTLQQWMQDVSEELFEGGRRHDLDKDEIKEIEKMYSEGLTPYDASDKFLNDDN